MEIIDKSDVDKVGLPRYRGQKFGEYVNAIQPIVEQLIKDIDNNKDQHPENDGLQISLKKMIIMLGPRFENRHYNSIYIGIKYALLKYDIVVNIGTYVSGNKLFILRRRTKSDKIAFSYNDSVKK